MRVRDLFLVVAALLIATHGQAEDWPRFRGPDGQGHSAETNLPTSWSATDNVAWRAEIPGRGWSSPIVVGQRVFVTTATEQGASCRVLCLDRRSGGLLWNKEVHRQKPGQKREKNSYATPTPTSDGRHVYAVFYDGTIVALDNDGQLAWKNHDVDFYSIHGLGASPILIDQLLVMPYDGSSREDTQLGWKIPWNQAVLLAVDTRSGKTKWRGERGLSRIGHVTPIVHQQEQQQVIISPAGDCVQGFDAATGQRLWTVYSQGEGVTPSPVLGRDLLFTYSGFEAPTIRAVRLDGSGEVTETHIAWEQRKGVPMLSSLLYVEPHVYSVTDAGVVSCFEENTGELVWQKRIGGTHSASPIFAAGKIYFLSEQGESVIIEPGEKYREIARNTVNEPCLASYAVSRGQLFVRSDRHLFCIGTSSP